MSFPEALEELFLTTRHPVVVAGTHGKTTTTSLLAQVLHHAGYDPSLLVGGVPLNFNEGFRLGKGEHFVIEGDEYDTAYFDKGPKFLHYRPRTAIVTGAEFDHADIYRDTAHYESAFEKFYALLPQDGYVAACATFPNWKRLAVPAQYPGRRLVAVFEPRSHTAMRKIHQQEYAHAFTGAAEAFISQPTAIAKVPEAERVDAKRMAQEITAAGTPARWMEGPDAI